MTTRLLILGCLWYYGTDLQGKPVKFEDFPPEVYVQHLSEGRTHRLHALSPLPPPPQPSADYKLRSDHAATLIHKGELAPAIEILEAIEKEKPGEYVIAVNLGTAYELAGDNEKALRWIREGVKRNPQSHWGTEWLHVRILEAKIALGKDPAWLRTHRVLGVDFGKGLTPSMPTAWPDGHDAASTMHALEVQLSERLGFVKAPDPLTGSLIADLGDLNVLRRAVGYGPPLYALAIRYQAPDGELLARRSAHVGSIRPLDTRPIWIGAVVAVSALATALVLRARRRA